MLVCDFFTFYSLNNNVTRLWDVVDIFFTLASLHIGLLLLTVGLTKMYFSNNNLIVLLLGIELSMISITFIIITALSNHLCSVGFSAITILFCIVTAVVCESAIGLTLLLLIFKVTKGVRVEDLTKLRG